MSLTISFGHVSIGSWTVLKYWKLIYWINETFCEAESKYNLFLHCHRIGHISIFIFLYKFLLINKIITLFFRFLCRGTQVLNNILILINFDITIFSILLYNISQCQHMRVQNLIRLIVRDNDDAFRIWKELIAWQKNYL